MLNTFLFRSENLLKLDRMEDPRKISEKAEKSPDLSRTTDIVGCCRGMIADRPFPQREAKGSNMASAKYVKKVESGDAFPYEQGKDSIGFVGKRRSRIEKLLAVAVVVILIVAVVFIALYAREVNRNKTLRRTSNAKESSTSAPTASASICLTQHCVTTASG